MDKSYILGISADFHDSAACLISNGEILAAAREVRFSSKKHDPIFPSNASEYYLAQANIDANDLSAIVFFEKPFLKF